jgi:SAM-dependent methyltransferase
VVYPALVSRLGNPQPIQALREQIVPLARGDVLEIGVGSGVNFRYYDQANVERLYALEPNAGMLRLAHAERRRTSLNIQFLTLPGERIPLEDESVDTVVSTFTLCTIPALEQALHGIARVLKPDGLLIFLENSLANRSTRAVLAAAVGADPSPGVPRPPAHARHSLAHRGCRFWNQARGSPVSQPVSKIMDALLLGHGGQRPVKGHRRRHTFGLQASLYYKQRL